jgi:hydrogenase-4 membrane subunit HyfE
VSGALLWLLVAAGLLVVVIRRRSVAVALVSAQALLLAGYAFATANDGGEIAAAAALALRGAALATLFLVVTARTRELRHVRAPVTPLVRAGVAVALGLALIWLVPQLGLSSRNAERTVLALVAFGLTVAATRRATLFQVLGIVMVENGLALAALLLPGASSPTIELGVAFDLTLIALVAAVFHERIFEEFGSGDSGALRSLRD